MNIDLHIEELVLNGLGISSAHGPVVQAAVETELKRLIATGGLQAGIESGGIPAGGRTAEMTLTGRADAKRTGAQIAEAVYRQIGQHKGTPE